MSVRSLNTGYSALTAARVGIETASNNIANANTEGYTRQRLHLRPALPTSLTFGQIGNGVEFAEITRTRDAFLDDRVRGATASLQALQARTDLLNRAEATLGEPDFGISASLDSLWDSFEELRIDPTSRGSQVEVLHQLESLAARIRQIATEVNAVADSTRTALSARIDDVNAITGRIAHLNQAITRAGGIDGNPNNLLDRRDLAVDQLVELTGAKAPLDDDVDYARLGKKFELAGGHIKNAILRATYRACDDGDVIRHKHLNDAAIAECQAQGKIVRAKVYPNVS